MCCKYLAGCFYSASAGEDLVASGGVGFTAAESSWVVGGGEEVAGAERPPSRAPATPFGVTVAANR